MNKEETQLVILVLIIALLFALVGSNVPMRRTSGPRPPTDIELVESWLECIDCQGPFLKRLHDLPGARRDSMVKLLSSALRDGPSSARRARHERDLERAWISDSAYRQTLDLTETSQTHTAFLKRYREGFDAKWRGRAAMALGVIRTPSALAALDSALGAPAVGFGDSVVQKWVARARSDTTGPEAVNHYP
jgi:hypothetical protein